MLLPELREAILWYSLRLVADRLVTARQGNISALDREAGLCAITPSAIEPTTMTLEDIVVLDLDGELVEGHYRPTSEYRMHTLIYRRRPDVAAIIHSHAPMASVFAVTHETMPLVLGESAATIGHPVRVAPYASPGSIELGEVCLEAMGEGGTAVIMAHHGLLVVGPDLPSAYSSTVAVEDNARVLIHARTIGATPHEVPEEVTRELHQYWLKGYRQKRE